MNDYAEQFRRDLKANDFPAEVIVASAKSYLNSLRGLQADVPDRDQAITDVNAFLQEHSSV